MKTKNQNTQKNFVRAFSILLLFASAYACKKKGTEDVPASVNVLTITPSSKPKSMSAKVNGQGWTMYKNGNVMFSSAGSYMYSGQTALTSPYSIISIYFQDTVGIINLPFVPSWKYYITYKNEGGVTFSSKTGILNITQFDTTGNSFPKRFVAKFSFMTDTINGASYNVTDGNIDFEN